MPTREIPIKSYSPDLANPGPFPLIMVSHGLGGTADETVVCLAEELAAHGYIVVAVQHRSSNWYYFEELNKQIVPFLAAAAEPETRFLRPWDIQFVLDAIEDEAAGVDLLALSLLDLDHIGIIGHSFGA